jgi:hypothetical protein
MLKWTNPFYFLETPLFSAGRAVSRILDTSEVGPIIPQLPHSRLPVLYRTV